MDKDLIKKLLDNVVIMSIATTNEDGSPWCSAVYFGYEEDLTLYWVSWVDANRSQNIMRDGRAMAMIFDSTLEQVHAHGLYIEGRAEMLTVEEDKQKAADAIYLRKDGVARGVSDYQMNTRMFFRLTPDKIWTNVDSVENGHFKDNRIEIKL